MRDAIGIVLDDVGYQVKQREAGDRLREIVPQTRELLDDQFRRLLHWSYRETSGALTRTIPRRWMRAASPAVVAVGEAEIDLPPSALADIPEPVTDERMSDEEWEAFCREHIFPPPDQQTVERIIYRPINGVTWQERLETLSKKISDPEKLAGILATGASQGMSRQELVKQIQPLVSGIASSARRIARTEGLRVTTAIQKQQTDQLGDMLQGYQIIATLDQNTRPHHAVRNGTMYWSDKRRKLTVDDMPELPDEPNCRCYPVPVLKPPVEFETDPQLRSEFQNAAGNAIPDPDVYSQWFDNADVGRRKMAVGATRYKVMQQKLGDSREPRFSDFIDPADGRLLTAAELKKEELWEREFRAKQVTTLMEERQKLLGKVSRFGFISKHDPGPPDPPPAPPPKPPAPPKPKPAEPPGQGPYYRGVTAPVSDAIKLEGSKAQRAIARAAVDAINAVHGDGELEKIPLRWGKSSFENGSYTYRGRIPVKITISKYTKTPRLTAAHEMGHFLDQQGIGKKTYASEDPQFAKLFGAWRKAVHESGNVRRLNEMLQGEDRIEHEGERVEVDKEWIRYALTERELFARSYAQWIAGRSNDDKMKAELRSTQEFRPHRSQWDDEEFEPIAAAMDEMFQELGWLK